MGALKTERFSKMAKNGGKSFIFFSNNMHVKGVETFQILFFFILSELKLKMFYQFYIHETMCEPFCLHSFLK